MNQFLAIVMDTWRQSVRQVVFIIMLIVLLIVTVAFIVILNKVEPEFSGDVSAATEDITDAELAAEFKFTSEQLEEMTEEEIAQLRERSALTTEEEETLEDVVKRVQLTEPGVGWIFNDSRIDRWVEWNTQYLFAKKMDSGQKFESMQDIAELASSTEIIAIEEEIIRETGLSTFERTVLMMSSTYSYVLFMFAMWFFIAAAAGYFPGLMESGAVDVVLAKPMTRLQVFAAKYAGGLVLVTLALTLCHTIYFIGMGMKFGVWPLQTFYSLPIEIFVAALLYALLALIGVLSRSAIVAILVGYIFYLVVDTALGAFYQAQALGFLEEGSTIDTIGEWARKLLPNFTVLKDTAVNASLSLPVFDTEPLWVGAAWLVISLGLGFWRFSRRDF